MKRLLLIVMLLTAAIGAHAQINCQASPSPCVTLIGSLSSSNGIPAKNFTLTFQPSQQFFIAGQGVAINSSTSCATSIDGKVVGIRNPLTTTSITRFMGSGTLPAGTYYVQYTFYTTSPAAETYPSPVQTIQLPSSGGITVNPPSVGIPSGAAGMKVYIGTSSSSMTLQGFTSGTNSFTISSPLVAGIAPPTTNSTVCQQVANDAGWPSGTGYKVAMFDQNGNSYPGYPMQWQLMGPGTTINLANGLPYYHGTVMYPTPILAVPLNHATQSISGILDTWGYQYQGTAPLDTCLRGNGVFYAPGLCGGPGGGGGNESQPVDIGVTYNGKPGASMDIVRHPFPFAVDIPVDCDNSYLIGETAATATATFTLQKCTSVGVCSSFGTAVFDPGDTFASFSCSTATHFSQGDYIKLTAPSSQDATLALMGGSIYGTRAGAAGTAADGRDLTWNIESPTVPDSGRFQHAITWSAAPTEISCDTESGTVQMTIEYRTDPNTTGTPIIPSPLTCSTSPAGTPTFTVPTIPASSTNPAYLTPVFSGSPSTTLVRIHLRLIGD